MVVACKEARSAGVAEEPGLRQNVKIGAQRVSEPRQQCFRRLRLLVRMPQRLPAPRKGSHGARSREICSRVVLQGVFKVRLYAAQVSCCTHTGRCSDSRQQRLFLRARSGIPRIQPFGFGGSEQPFIRSDELKLGRRIGRSLRMKGRCQLDRVESTQALVIDDCRRGLKYSARYIFHAERRKFTRQRCQCNARVLFGEIA